MLVFKMVVRMSNCYRLPMCDKKWKKKMCVCGGVRGCLHRRDYLANFSKWKRFIPDTAHTEEGTRLRSSETSVFTLELLVASPTRSCPLVSRHLARSRGHTQAHAHTRVRHASSALLSRSPSQAASLYLAPREDAGRRWLCRCHQSPPLAPSVSADWGPLRFQQVPWSRRSYSRSLGTKPPRLPQLTRAVTFPIVAC